MSVHHGYGHEVRRFSCPQCSSRIFFEDQTCLNCHAEVAYDPATDDLGFALDTCVHRHEWRCNWVAGALGQCVSCATDVEVRGPAVEITAFQTAKRRVMRQLLQLDLAPSNSNPLLCFVLRHGTDEDPVTIGHAGGVVTLDISEADSAQLERVRRRMGEPYRTPVGHIRHETGHWHWQAYVNPDPLRLEQFRELFGDDRRDYATALEAHYNGIEDGSWRGSFLSHYATAHPWEDYAESFAHVLHMLDMVETGVAEGFITGEFRSLADVYDRWAPLTVSLNELARSMGTAEPYPFAPSPTALRKMSFVYDVITASSSIRHLGR